VRFGSWLLLGQSAAFLAGMILAIRDLTSVSSVPTQEWDPADAADFHAVMSSIERGRILLLVLLAAACAVVGVSLLRRRGIGPRFALLGLNVLLATAWAYTALSSVERVDTDAVSGMIYLSGLDTGLGYVGASGALVLLVVDILALANPSTLPEHVDLD